MLDALTSLAFSMYSTKGVYALMLGSGISRSARIPTGWEITLDLVLKVATIEGEGERCGVDPAAWYVEKFGRQPDYAELLEMLGKTAEERQRLVQGYIEPTPQEHARGEKLPTAAHRAIARLVAAGFIRVLITTNFDRLLEIALQDAGVHPTVISSADHVQGAIPLVHAECVVIKVHGDYLDTRIRNTPTELATYHAAMDGLLDRVFDEFGLVVCGWSAEWDTALKAAIERAPSRRYSMYWAVRGEPSAAAQGLIARRGASVIPIQGADSFFHDLADRIMALESLKQRHPLSAPLAVAMLKEYMPEPRHRIRLHDLINGEFDHALRMLEDPVFQRQQFSDDNFNAQVRRYEAAVEVLMNMAFTAGRWATHEQALQWRDVIVVLAKRAAHSGGGLTVLIGLMRYPAVLVMQAFALGAIVGRNYEALGMLATSTFPYTLGSRTATLTDGLSPSTFIDSAQDIFKKVPGYDRKQLAASQRVADVLKPMLKAELLDDDAITRAYTAAELVCAAGYAERVARAADDGHFWAPVGLYVFEGQVRADVIAQWQTEIEAQAEQAPVYLMAGLKKKPRFAEIEELASRFF